MSDKELNEIYSNEDKWNDFIAGSLVSAISGVALPGQGNVINDIKSGRDTITGNTQNEQKIIDTEVEKRFNEEISKNDKKLSKGKKINLEQILKIK